MAARRLVPARARGLATLHAAATRPKVPTASVMSALPGMGVTQAARSLATAACCHSPCWWRRKAYIKPPALGRLQLRSSFSSVANASVAAFEQALIDVFGRDKGGQVVDTITTAHGPLYVPSADAKDSAESQQSPGSIATPSPPVTGTGLSLSQAEAKRLFAVCRDLLEQHEDAMLDEALVSEATETTTGTADAPQAAATSAGEVTERQDGENTLHERTHGEHESTFSPTLGPSHHVPPPGYLVLCARALELCSEAGLNEASYALGRLYLQGAGGDARMASRVFMCLARRGHGESLFHLAGMYLEGNGVKRSREHALNLYKLGAERGVVEAYHNLGNIFLQDAQTNEQMKHDLEKIAATYFETGAEAGSAACMIALGRMYSRGQGVDQDFEQAFSLFNKAAELGHPIGLFNVGTSYFLGKGTEQSFELAREHFERASEMGLPYAMINLGNMYFKGLGVDKDLDRARQYYQQALDSGEDDGQVLLERVEEALRAQEDAGSRTEHS